MKGFYNLTTSTTSSLALTGWAATGVMVISFLVWKEKCIIYM
jgi:hypothetical protein